MAKKDKKITNPGEIPQDNAGTQSVETSQAKTALAPIEEPDAPETHEGTKVDPEVPGKPETPDDTIGTVSETPADSESETPPSPATSFSQTPEELKGRKKKADESKKKSTESDVLGAVATIADPDGKEGKLTAKGRTILAQYPKEPVVWMTADGLGFFREVDARNHAADKKEKTILTVTREQ